MQTKIEEGAPPAFITDWPDVYPDLRGVWTAWHRLSASRSMGFGGAGGIPFEALDRYARRYEVDDFEAFHHLVTAMDAEYLDHMRKQRDG